MVRETLCEIANVDIATLREMLCDSVHVVNGPMASVSCGLGHLTETYRNVARVATVYHSLARIAIVFSVAVVVVVSFVGFAHVMVRCYARVSRIVESATADVAQSCLRCCYCVPVPTPCVPATPVQSIADSTCPPASPGAKRALLHDSQANAEIGRVGPRGKGVVLKMAPDFGQWQQCSRGRKCVTSCKRTLKMRINNKPEILVGKFICDDSCNRINESSFSHVNVSNMPVSVTYLALQLEVELGVFPETKRV